ncbi:hypothetical protein NE237_003479 [Protea cynaroides]|uniref:Uncharacterized protein n=1 Tax=Protea cynaroides TaxID=273540 RepID=A0A9Q0QSM3_9MAGN|nr:hypothetical protein NE237_003479 [Protea cynaroides]
MDDHCFPDLVGAMDRLWFHQIILFSESITVISPKITISISETPESPLSSSSNFSAPTYSEDEILSASSSTPPQDDFNNEAEESRPTRLNLEKTKIRYQSSSPLVKKTPKLLRYSSFEGMSLRRTKSCKSEWELEFEELKGFKDLGFTFKKEQLTPRMMSVIPGLQRLEEYEERAFKDDEIQIDSEEEERRVTKPYLSEAWLIKRPDSPLLNLRMPRGSATADMKKHLRYWARTVADEIQQES